MPDGWERDFGLDPNDPSDRDLDLDNDGYTNLQEFLRGLRPDEALRALISVRGQVEVDSPVGLRGNDSIGATSYRWSVSPSSLELLFASNSEALILQAPSSPATISVELEVTRGTQVDTATASIEVVETLDRTVDVTIGEVVSCPQTYRLDVTLTNFQNPICTWTLLDGPLSETRPMGCDDPQIRFDSGASGDGFRVLLEVSDGEMNVASAFDYEGEIPVCADAPDGGMPDDGSGMGADDGEDGCGCTAADGSASSPQAALLWTAIAGFWFLRRRKRH